MGNSAPVRAGIYCRISLAAMGDTTKTDDQERICRDLAERLGWEIAEGVGRPNPDGVYTDGSKSAWQPDRKRPGWDQMITDIEADRINGIIVYHGDRLLRTHDDLLTLIRLARTRGLWLAGPTGVRDIGNYDDQFILEIEASMAKRESANISRRRKAQYDRWRREGRVRPGGRGGRPFGFASDNATLHPADRCDVASHREVTEADIIREMAARILAAESASAIARDLTVRGWRTSTGGPLTQTFVRRLLARPRYAGLMPDGETAAAWETVLDRETWEQVRLALDARGVFNPAPTSMRRWLLSGIAACGAEGCGRPLQIGATSHGADGRGYPGYSCIKGCVRRSAAHLDRYVSARVVALLNDPRQPEGKPPAPPDLMPEWEALTRERADTQALLADYTRSAGIARSLADRIERIDKRMAEFREREAEDARSRLLGRYRGITRGQFDALPLEVRRALVAASYRVIVLPSSGRGPGFRTEDVRLEPA